MQKNNSRTGKDSDEVYVAGRKLSIPETTPVAGSAFCLQDLHFIERMPELTETDFITLRKISYTDNAIILSGISGECGRLSFMVRGGSNRKDFPVLDIFRLLHVQFLPGRDSMARLTSADLIEDFGQLANDFSAYQTAAWISAFSMQNVMPMLPHPLFVNAVEVALRRLVHGSFPSDALKTCVCLAFIFEEGWLAHALHAPKAAEQCRQLLEMAEGKPGPQLSEECWKKQFEWCQNILLVNECKIP